MGKEDFTAVVVKILLHENDLSRSSNFSRIDSVDRLSAEDCGNGGVWVS